MKTGLLCCEGQNIYHSAYDYTHIEPNWGSGNSQQLSSCRLTTMPAPSKEIHSCWAYSHSFGALQVFSKATTALPLWRSFQRLITMQRWY